MNDNVQTLTDIFFQESRFYKYALLNQNSINYNDMYSSYTNLPKLVLEANDAVDEVIPRIMHYIWFTNENNPKQIPKEFLENFKLELKKLDNYNLSALEPWKAKLWVNCKDCIAPSLERISSMGYPVEIMQWQSEDFGKTRSYLQETLTNLVGVKNAMGTIYDAARFIIAEKYGGFLPDFDYNTGNSTEIIVQRGYHSFTMTEINYFGFKPQHKILTFLNDGISDLFKIVENHNMNSVVFSLNANQFTGLFAYGPSLKAIELFSGKEDLVIEPECSICDISFNELEYPINLFDLDDDETQCSINAPELCYIGDHQNERNDNIGPCYIIIEDGLIDFGVGNYLGGNNSGSWEENWQENGE